MISIQVNISFASLEMPRTGAAILAAICGREAGGRGGATNILDGAALKGLFPALSTETKRVVIEVNRSQLLLRSIFVIGLFVIKSDRRLHTLYYWYSY